MISEPHWIICKPTVCLQDEIKTPTAIEDY
jgi:hypothetical protein